MCTTGSIYGLYLVLDFFVCVCFLFHVAVVTAVVVSIIIIISDENGVIITLTLLYTLVYINEWYKS